MSMISEQVNELREYADGYKKSDFGVDGIVKLLYQAADTIEALSAKLKTANEELEELKVVNAERTRTRSSNEILKEIREKAQELSSKHWVYDERHLIGKGIQCMCIQAENIINANMERSAEDCGVWWITASERMPEEERCIDPETGYYGRSDDVLCSAYNEYEMRDEIWIDYTIDGEWQTHEWYEGEKLAWMPLPTSYRDLKK